MKATAAISGQTSSREIFKMILPREHGSWSLALEPVAFGLLAAPSAAGYALTVAALAVFFLRRPLKVLSREETCERQKSARIAILLLGIVAASAFFLVIKSGGISHLWPLVPAALAGGTFAWFDSRNEGREGAAEVAGAVSFGILPAAFASLAGWGVVESFALAAVMLGRSLPTVLCVRTYLRIKKGRVTTIVPAIVAATVSLLLVTLLAMSGFVPCIAVAFSLVLVARTIFLLTSRRPFSAKSVGIMEAVFGVVMVLATAVAWRFF